MASIEQENLKQQLAALAPTPPEQQSAIPTDGPFQDFPSVDDDFSPFSQESLDPFVKSRSQRASEVVRYGIPAVMAGFADTFTTSLGILDEGDMTLALKNSFESFGTFYERNAEAARTVGDLTGMFIPGMAALKVFRTGSILQRALTGGKRNKLLGSVFASGQSMDKILRGVRARDLFLAKQGTLNFADDAVRQGLIRRATTTKLADTIKETMAFEAGVFATMNSSDILYPDEMTTAELIALNALFPSAFAIGENLFMRRLIRASAQRPELADIAREVRGANTVPLDDIIFRPGQRDLGLTTLGIARAAANQASQEAEEVIKASALNSSALTLRSEIQKEAVLLGRDSILPGFTKQERFSEKAPEIRSVVKAVEDDPTVMLGAFDMQKLPLEGINEAQTKIIAMKTREAKIKKIRNKEKSGKPLEQADLDQITGLQREMDQIDSAQAMVLETDGTLSLNADRKVLWQDNPSRLERFRATTETGDFKTTFTVTKPPRGASQEVAFTEDGILRLPRVKGETVKDRFDNLSIYNQTAVWGVINSTVDNYKPGTGLIQLTDDDHFTAFDYVLALQERYGDNVIKDIQMPNRATNMEELRFESLRKKYESYVDYRERIDKFAEDPRIPALNKMNMNDLTAVLNLPRTNTGDPHPVMKIFEDVYQQADRTLDEARIYTYQQFNRLMQEDAFFPELTNFLNSNIDTTGRMLRMDATRAPVFLWKRPVDIRSYNRDLLVNQTAHMRSQVMSDFAGARTAGATLVGNFFEEAVKHNPVVQQAQKVDRLVEGTQKGSGVLGTQQRARGETATIQSSQFFQELTDKSHHIEVGRLFEPYTGNWTKLRAPQHRADAVSFSTYANARRQGWQTEPETQALEGGLYGFMLSDTERNRDRWKLLFGTEMPEGAMMPAPTPLQGGTRQYKPLAVTQLAMDVAQSMQDLGQVALSNMNQIKKIYGRGATSFKPWWVPPKNLSRDDIVFIVDGNTNKTINIVTGSNQQQAVAIAQREIAERNQEGLMYVTKDDIGRYFSLQDDAMERFMDFSDPLNQSGPSKGKAVNIGLIEDGPAVLNEMVDTMERYFESILRRSRAAYFEPQIAYAKRLYNSNQPSTAKKGQSIWQQYLATIFGNPTLNPNDMVGKIYFATESVTDDMLETVWQKSQQSAGMKPTSVPGRDQKLFDRYAKTLGDHNPFADSMDFVERRLQVQSPPRLKTMLPKLNHLTSLLTLRLFEVGHSVLTLTSLGATMPGVIKALRRMPHENEADYAARIGAFGLKVADDNAMFHPTRAITSTIHEFFNNPEFRRKMVDDKDPKSAVSRGFMDQNVSEAFKTITAPKEGYAENLFRRATDYMSMLSDKSERLARGISFATGYNIAKRGLLMEDDNAAFAFAHRFANETIGNYAPNNRPRIFQGAVGMPLGLFMTFMWNYYERIFGYIANRQNRALAVQYATQAAVFGGQTIPGFQQFSEFFASNYDGTVNIVDGLENKFGTETAEWLLYGTLSNLPKLFGADDGIALSTRGDVNIRNVPTLFTFQDTPVYAMIRDGVTALRRGFEMVRERGGFDAQQSAEILQNYSTSRFFRNLGYLSTGVVTDRQGQPIGRRDTLVDILQGDVQNSLGLVASIAGLRTIDENRRVQSAYRIRSGELSRRSRIRQLRDRLRSDARAGLTPDDVNQAVASYVKYGGNPDYFPRFLFDNYLAATVNKDLKKLNDIISSPTRGADVQRLLSTVGVSTENDPEFQ